MDQNKKMDNAPEDKMEYTDLYIGIAKATLYHIIRLCFNLVRAVFWLVNGTMFKHWATYKPENYESSAHIYNIAHRYKLDVILGQASFEDFLLTHDRFVHPAYLLRDECVLYQVTQRHAIFIQVADGVDIWRSQYGSFLRQAQFDNAVKVITLPLSHMEHLAETLGPMTSKMLFIQNTARCGSTLLVRMFEETGRCVAFCEPDAVNGICKLAMTKKLWNRETGNRVVRNLVRLQCKPVKSLAEPPLAYVMKMTAPSMDAAPFVLQAFPDAQHLFMYRDYMKVGQSLAVAAEVMPTLKLAYFLGSIHEKGLQFAVSQMGTSNTVFNIRLIGHALEPGIVLYAITVRVYLQMLQQNMRIKAVRFEDLEENPQYFIKKILKYCRLPLSLADLALRALDVDAQKNSALSQSNLKKKRKNYKMNPALVALIEKLFEDYGVPRGNAAVLPDTITHLEEGSSAEVEESHMSTTDDIMSYIVGDGIQPKATESLQDGISSDINPIQASEPIQPEITFTNEPSVNASDESDREGSKSKKIVYTMAHTTTRVTEVETVIKIKPEMEDNETSFEMIGSQMEDCQEGRKQPESTPRQRSVLTPNYMRVDM